MDCSACGSSGYAISGDLNLLEKLILKTDARYIIVVEKVFPLLNFSINTTLAPQFPCNNILGTRICLACYIPAASRGSHIQSNSKHSYNRQRVPRYCHKVNFEHIIPLELKLQQLSCLFPKILQDLPVSKLSIHYSFTCAESIFASLLIGLNLNYEVQCRFLLHRLSRAFPDLPILALVDWYGRPSLSVMLELFVSTHL